MHRPDSAPGLTPAWLPYEQPAGGDHGDGRLAMPRVRQVLPRRHGVGRAFLGEFVDLS
jgi:hypothetical protein